MTTRRLVLGYDGSTGARAAVEWCIEHAGLFDAEVVVVGVVDAVFMDGLSPAESPAIGLSFDATMDAMVQAVTDVVTEAVEALEAADISCRPVIVRGNPAQSLDRVANENSAELIVVGRRGSGGFVEMLLGSVPHTLAHHATVPLVIVPAGD